MTSPNNHLIVALDVATAVEAQKIVYELGDSASFYKVGLQLFAAEGPKIVSELTDSGRKVFLDLKLHDIPNTVAGAVKAASALGSHMLTVHAGGGARMLESAVEAARSTTQPPLILAVTVLTSFSQPDLEETGVRGGLSDHVLYLGRLAKSAGCGGVVASPNEARNLRSALGTAMAIVTPGIRPEGSESGDQSRVATPSAAIRAGASHVVVGRPILGAANRRRATAAIVEEIDGALRASEMEMAGSRPA